MHLYHNFAEQSVDGTEDIWFINFYSPHCSHCHELAPTVSNLFTLVTIYNYVFCTYSEIPRKFAHHKQFLESL